ncbi:hypothetical protein PPERSA_00087 [Pseudocohnilembus persalinus]|uniref:Intraflagellar transport protein 52 n=1 Tax=Pseudocohnilembus persalinus TaxID=266149 RepID=A0A0V0QXT3_PSEPJ|nr:hypothetical protein PPERSA_00087 [Pseudocohnilembus persalinus]|eukprot:KRX07177.1 hypothetical protein PPERSA_00087 [Pseudocohnilembus persalinus]
MSEQQTNQICNLNKEEIIYEKLKHAHLIIFSGSREPFTENEINVLSRYLEEGGNVLCLLNEGGDDKNNTNINALTEKYGIECNSDCVVRTCFAKYFHPKEAYITNGILNQEVARQANSWTQEQVKKPQNQFLSNIIGKDEEDEYTKEQNRGGLDFVYVNGATLKCDNKAIPFLGSGPLSYPSNRPVGCAYIDKKSQGKLVVMGSYEMFTDEYFEKEDNAKIFDFLIKLFFSKNVQFDKREEDQVYTKNYPQIPDISELADKLKSCLQETDDLPLDYNELFNQELFKFDTDLIPEAVGLYIKIGVKHEPLTLIVPQFETPMLGLQPAIFPPILRELPPPSLEQFDLDEEFASEKVRLAQLTNKCFNKDIEYFVKTSGDILGISDKVSTKHNSKAILAYILKELVQLKKFNQ